eukprot:3058907-Prymnesium_polylepis.1
MAHAAAESALELAVAPIACVGCGEAEACMMHLPCQHVALCTPCWLAGSRVGEICAHCGAASHSAICVHRP